MKHRSDEKDNKADLDGLMVKGRKVLTRAAVTSMSLAMVLGNSPVAWAADAAAGDQAAITLGSTLTGLDGKHFVGYNPDNAETGPWTPYGRTTFKNDVSYTNLKPSTKYTAKLQLWDVTQGKYVDAVEDSSVTVDGKQVDYKLTQTFTTDAAKDGATTVSGTITDLGGRFKDAKAIQGDRVVAHVSLYEGDAPAADATPVATYKADQDGAAIDEAGALGFPKIVANATALVGGKDVPLDKNASIVDKVIYAGLTPGAKYTLKGSLHYLDEKTGTSDVDKPDNNNGGGTEKPVGKPDFTLPNGLGIDLTGASVVDGENGAKVLKVTYKAINSTDKALDNSTLPLLLDANQNGTGLVRQDDELSQTIGAGKTYEGSFSVTLVDEANDVTLTWTDGAEKDPKTIYTQVVNPKDPNAPFSEGGQGGDQTPTTKDHIKWEITDGSTTMTEKIGQDGSLPAGTYVYTVTPSEDMVLTVTNAGKEKLHVTFPANQPSDAKFTLIDGDEVNVSGKGTFEMTKFTEEGDGTEVTADGGEVNPPSMTDQAPATPDASATAEVTLPNGLRLTLKSAEVVEGKDTVGKPDGKSFLKVSYGVTNTSATDVADDSASAFAGAQGDKALAANDKLADSGITAPEAKTLKTGESYDTSVYLTLADTTTPVDLKVSDATGEGAKELYKTTLKLDALGDAFKAPATSPDTPGQGGDDNGDGDKKVTFVDGGEVKDASGNAITATKEFTAVEDAKQASDVQDVTFNLDTTGLAGRRIVVFEELVAEDGTSVAKFANLTTADSSVQMPSADVLVADSQGNVIRQATDATVSANVNYTNLTPGTEYTVTTQLKEVKAADDGGKGDDTGTGDDKAPENPVAAVFDSIATFLGINDRAGEVANQGGVNQPTTDGTDQGEGGDAEEPTYDGDVATDATGKAVATTTKVTPTASNGSVPVTLTFDSSKMAGKTYALVTTVTRGSVTYAADSDTDDAGQAMTVASATSTLTGEDDAKEVSPSAETKLSDKVSYKSLMSGTKYTVTGTLVDGETGEALKDKDGKEVTATKDFTAALADGDETLDFTLDTTALAGKKVGVVATVTGTDDQRQWATQTDGTSDGATVSVKAAEAEGTVIGSLADTTDGKRETTADGDVRLTETLTYKDLKPETEYEISGVVHVLDEDGNDAGVLTKGMADGTAKPDEGGDQGDAGNGGDTQDPSMANQDVVIKVDETGREITTDGKDVPAGNYTVTVDSPSGMSLEVKRDGKTVKAIPIIMGLSQTQNVTLAVGDTLSLKSAKGTSTVGIKGNGVKMTLPVSDDKTDVPSDPANPDDSGDKGDSEGTDAGATKAVALAADETGDTGDGSGDDAANAGLFEWTLDKADSTMTKKVGTGEGELRPGKYLYDINPTTEMKVTFKHADGTEGGQSHRAGSPATMTFEVAEGDQIEVTGQGTFKVTLDDSQGGNGGTNGGDNGTGDGTVKLADVWGKLADDAVVATGKFTTPKAEEGAKTVSGTQTLEFQFTTKGFQGKTLVAYVALGEGGDVVAKQSDPKAADQTVTTPKASHKLATKDGKKDVEATTQDLVDTLDYEGLLAGEKYTATTKLHVYGADGSDLGYLKADGSTTNGVNAPTTDESADKMTTDSSSALAGSDTKNAVADSLASVPSDGTTNDGQSTQAAPDDNAAVAPVALAVDGAGDVTDGNAGSSADSSTDKDEPQATPGAGATDGDTADEPTSSDGGTNAGDANGTQTGTGTDTKGDDAADSDQGTTAGNGDTTTDADGAVVSTTEFTVGKSDDGKRVSGSVDNTVSGANLAALTGDKVVAETTLSRDGRTMADATGSDADQAVNVVEHGTKPSEPDDQAPADQPDQDGGDLAQTGTGIMAGIIAAVGAALAAGGAWLYRKFVM